MHIRTRGVSEQTLAMRSGRQLIVVAALIVGAIAGAAGTFAVMRVSPDSEPVAAEPTIEVASATTADRPPPPVDAVALDLAQALARIDALYAQREQDWLQTAAWVESFLETQRAESSPRSVALERVRRKLEIRRQAEEGKFLAGLDDDFMLMFATLLAGDEAIADLCALVEDQTLDLDMRKEALTSLGYVPSERSLALILAPPEDIGADPDYQLEHQIGRLTLLVDFLPTESIEPHAARIYGAAVSALRESGENSDAWNLVGALGWEHGHEASLQMLYDSRNTHFFGSELIQIAWWAGTESSRQFIDRIRTTHPDGGVRESAANILATWPES